jgi:hypothetical protein
MSLRQVDLYFPIFGGAMSSDRRESEQGGVRVELKYCEHCGGLWLRALGAGGVYCDKCQAKVADLPVPKKKPGRVRLPVGPHARTEDYGVDMSDDSSDFEAAGGVA